MKDVTATDCDPELPTDQDATTSVNATGNISTQTSDPIAHITDGDIDRELKTQREERAAPISKLGTFRGYESFRNLMRSLHKIGQQDEGKKTRTGSTYVGNDREAACKLLDIPFQYEQTDYDDNDPHVLEAATELDAERRRQTQGQAICTAVRTRLFHEEIQKQRPFHQIATYERLAQKFVGSERSHRSVRDARKVFDACPDLFACIERDYVSVAGAKRILDQADKTNWPEIVRALNDDREPGADDCDGEHDVQSRRRWRGDERIAPFLQRAKPPPPKKAQPIVRPIIQGKPELKNEKGLPAVMDGALAPATVQDHRGSDPDAESVDAGPGAGAAVPGVNDTNAGKPSRYGPPGEPAPLQETEADPAPADDLGIFKDSLTALIQLQGLLRTYRATDALIETLETTLNAARESRL